MTASLIVRDPGLFATIQDLGRWDYLKFGVSNSGAMDRVSLQIANMLVGNDPGEAAVEFTAMGGTYEVAAESCRMAVVGGDFPVSIDNEPAAPYTSHTLARGSRLSIGYSRSGMRGYLAVSGGFDLLPALGSLSTHIRFGLGGLNGKALAPDSRIPLKKPDLSPGADLFLDASLIPGTAGPIRVVMGPQDDYFAEDGIKTFLSSQYRVTGQSDRMGFRLDGPEIAHAGDFNIVSDGIAAGSVQVPGNRLPIVLLADRQTTGGYPKIATVITADLHRLAQMEPGEMIRFESVSVETAEDEYLRLRRCLENIAESLEPTDSETTETYRLLSANLIDGVCWINPNVA
jgi:5-oxoprolinase (ATP-hydrolysing) subunit C